jgi:uncharacterized protein
VRLFFITASRKPIVTGLVVLLITVIFATAAVKGFRIETDLNKYMPNDHPAFVFSRQAEEWFNITDGVMIAISNPDGIFQTDTLAKIVDISDALGELDGIDPDNVMSLSTADNITGSDWGLEVAPFFESPPESSSAMASLRLAVAANPMIHGRLVSTDATSALVVARISAAGFSDGLYAQVTELAHRFEGPEEIYVAGRPIVEGALAELGPADMARMLPIVLIVIVLVLFALLRSVRNTLLSLLVVALSVIWTFGLMALLGVPVYAVSTMIPVMLVAIGVAYSIHIFNSAALYLEGHSPSGGTELANHVISVITRPVVMTALTTVVGFLSLLTSAVLPVRYFGLFTGFGVLSAMLLSLTLIPASFVLLGPPKPSSRGQSRIAGARLAERLAKIVVGRWKIIVIVALAVLTVSLVFIPRVWIDSSFVSNFPDDSDIVRTDKFVNTKFAGTSTLNVILESDTPETFKRPDVLRHMNELQTALERSEVVGDSLSIADYLKRMHQAMHGDQSEYNVVPDSEALIAQYLFLYEMSADPDAMAQVVDYDYLRANITVQLRSDSTRTLEEIIRIADSYVDAFEELGIRLNYAGSGYRAFVFAQLILNGQIKSLAVSILIVITLLTIMFRSVKIGLIGSVPIVITAVANFGIMGILGVPLSISTALISSIAVGIGIDYAIHFIERYKDHMTRLSDRAAAASLTMFHSGRAILFNATVVTAGFAVLLFSVFPPNRQVGGLIALNMIVSFLGTVTVLFLLLYRGGVFMQIQDSPKRTMSNEEITDER